MSLPRSRLATHEEHPSRLIHWHFFSQRFGLAAHQDLHSPAVGELAVVVSVVSVVAAGTSPPPQEQQCYYVMSFMHLWHLKDPPCGTQAFMFLSSSRIASGDVDGAGDVVVTEDEVVAGGELVRGHSVHWHLFSY